MPGLAISQEQRDSSVASLDPVGTWRCVLYGNPTLGDERVLLNFAPDQSARIARMNQTGSPSWAPLSAWTVVDGVISFADARSGRQFSADLRRDALGGEWRTLNLLGGWWCVTDDSGADPGSAVINTPASGSGEYARQLIPEVMATPTFPVQAIREAREGRVVLCFTVAPSGEVFEPEFVELSDELFRAPSLDALMRSRYKPWNPRTEGGSRPACRSFIYRLDYIY